MHYDSPPGGLMKQLPRYVTLYLSTTTGAECTRLELLKSSAYVLREPYQNIVAISCDASDFYRLCNEWSQQLDYDRCAEIRCRLVSGQTEPSPSDLMHTRSLKQLIEWVNGQWLRGFLTSRRLVTYFQPIVDNRTPSKVFAYECLVRGVQEDGQLIMPGRLFSAARATGQLNQLDHAARLTAIRAASEQQLRSCIFINFNPRFVDRSFQCLQSTIQAANLSGIPPNRFVFEVVESDDIEDVGKLMRIVDYCRSAGCRVALDDFGAGYNSLTLMGEVKPDFIKLDMDLIQNVDRDLYKSRVAAKLIELAQDLNVQTVVEGIETTEAWRWTVEHGADYGQGYLFARPSSAPPIPIDPEIACDEAPDAPDPAERDTSLTPEAN